MGVYHYSYADCTDDAVLEAQFCLKNIANKQLEYPIYFDIDDSEMLALTNQKRTDICKAFCETIENAGYCAMIYCNLDWYNNRIISSQIADYDLWLVQWYAGTPSVPCGIWQKADNGTIDGISGNVDLNVAHKDYPSIMKAKGLNGFSANSSDNASTYLTYTVQKGDSLWAISQKLLGAGSRYPDIKTLNSLASDMIYPGQVLKIPNRLKKH